MTSNEKIEVELGRLLTTAPDHRRKQILESTEYKMAMNSGDVTGALDFALGVIHGKGKTKAEGKRNAKKIKKENDLNEFV